MAEARRKFQAKRMEDLVAQILKSPAFPRRGEAAELCAAWSRAAGADVARRSRPVRLRQGELLVSFESSALRQEVEAFRKDEILAKLRREYPSRRIASIRCTLQG